MFEVDPINSVPRRGLHFLKVNGAKSNMSKGLARPVKSNLDKCRAAAVAGNRVHALACGTWVPRREDGNRADALRGPRLLGVEATFGSGLGRAGVRRVTHATAAGGKTRG